MSIKLRKLEHASELKMGLQILSIDEEGNEALEVIDCIDGNDIYTASLHNPHCFGWEGDLDTYLENYQAVYAVESEESK